MRFAEEYKIVLTSAIDLNVGGTQDTDSVDMSRYHHCTYLIDVGTMTGADSVMTIASGAAAGDYTSVLSFDYAYGQTTAIYSAPGVGHDVLDAWTNAATLAIVQATYPNFLLVVSVDASQMDVANAENWMTMRFTDSGGATGLVSVTQILSPRYKTGQSISAVV
jgi:hypothetical protein